MTFAQFHLVQIQEIVKTIFSAYLGFAIQNTIANILVHQELFVEKILVFLMSNAQLNLIVTKEFVLTVTFAFLKMNVKKIQIVNFLSFPKMENVSQKYIVTQIWIVKGDAKKNESEC